VGGIHEFSSEENFMKKILLAALLSVCFTGIVFAAGSQQGMPDQEQESNSVTQNIQPPEWLWGTWHAQINSSAQILLIGDHEFSISGTDVHNDNKIVSMEDAADDTMYLVYIKLANGDVYNQEFYKPSIPDNGGPTEIHSTVISGDNSRTTVVYIKE
jgi:hypothetical protein